MTEVAYVFERFPSYVQTFCYREVSELHRQGVALTIFSIRRPEHEPPQDWDNQLIERVHYLPNETELRDEVVRAGRNGLVSKDALHAIEKWGRQSDFLRLYQAVYIGIRLRERNLKHVHAHFAGLAARTAFWIKEFFGIPYSFTAHANDIFAPRPFVIGLDKLINSASAVVTESDYAAALLRTQFPQSSKKILRIYNGIEVSQFHEASFDASVPLIISVGRLVEKKGFTHLIEACRRLKERGCNFRCEIIGEGPLADSLRAQIVKSELETVVRLAGAQTQNEIARTSFRGDGFLFAVRGRARRRNGQFAHCDRGSDGRRSARRFHPNCRRPRDGRGHRQWISGSAGRSSGSGRRSRKNC